MNEDQLIFLISQPRSGSTLTQKLLGAHSEIYTRSEPWLMLPPSYTLKDSGIYAEYNFHTERTAFEGFLDELPGGKQAYIDELKGMYLNLYSRYLSNTDCSYFLDKTPRYYLIFDELLQIYPNAKYILLIRNPLAVLGSMINTWTRNNWYNLSKMKYDLLQAIDKYIEIINRNDDGVFIVHYEEMLADNEKTLTEMFHFLNIDFEDGIHDYNSDREKWELGDQESVYNKKGVDRDNDKKWQSGLDAPQYWRVMYDYLHYIGKDNFEKLGYDFEENKRVLMNNMPADTLKDIKSMTFSLFSFFGDTRECLIENQEIKKEIKMMENELNKEVAENKGIKENIKDVEDLLNKRTEELKGVYSSRKYKLAKLLAYPYYFIKEKL